MPDRRDIGLELEPHLEKLFRAAYRLTGNRADAEELVQETCVRAVEQHGQGEHLDSPLGWLMRVQYNLFIDGARRRARADCVAFVDEDCASLRAGERDEPEERVGRAQQMQRLGCAWRQLNVDQRALLALRVEGYSLAEMQAITGIGIDALNARLHRARQSLARHLQAENSDIRPPKRMGNER